MASPSSLTKSSSSSLASFTTDSPRFQGCAAAPRRPPPLTVRAGSRFPNKGSSSNGSSDAVDANLGVLRDRIEEVRIKERLQLTCSTVLGRSPSLRMMTRPPSSTSSTGGVDHHKGQNNHYGWNYSDDAQVVTKSRRWRRAQDDGVELVYQFFRLVALVSSTVGVTCLTGTCLIYLVSSSLIISAIN